MKHVFLILFTLLPFYTFAGEPLHVVISGIDSEKGDVLAISVFNQEEGFKTKESIIQEIIQLNPGQETYTFILTDVPEGPLMILGLQDANGNLEMDTGMFGIPKEGFFCSQNESKPKWDRCMFSYDGGETIIELEMIYW